MSFLERILEDPGRFAGVKRAFYAGLVAVAVVELLAPVFFDEGHAHFDFEELPAWGSLYGLAATVAIIAGSKLLGKWWLTRPEGYYERRGADRDA